MATAWHPIVLSRQLVFEGGFQNKSYRLETKAIETHKGVESCAKIDKRQEWLVKAAAGKNAQQGRSEEDEGVRGVEEEPG